MAFRRVQEAKEHGFSSHSRGDSGPGDRRWGMMRRGEKKEQGEDSGKQRAASPETKEGEKRKRREKGREEEEEDGWTELRLLGMNSRRGLSGREIDFHGWGLAVRTLAAVLRIV